MSCYPSKPERAACEPFVRCLNAFYSRCFTFKEHPDELDHRNPKPDAVYEDIASNARLAIERKSIIYPEDYAHSHQHDHRIMSYLFSNLPTEIAQGPFVLNMPFCHTGRDNSGIDQLANDICDFIHANIEEVRREHRISFESDGPVRGVYTLYHKDLDRWDETFDGPRDQLVVTMPITQGRLAGFDWGKMCETTVPQLMERAVRACSEKFKTYNRHRRILLIERYGDIQGPVHVAFESFVHAMSKPDSLDEIWDAWLETPDCDDPYWVYTRLWAKEASLPAGWQRPEICCRLGCQRQSSLDQSGVFWFSRE